METIIRRKPGGGRKRKLTRQQQYEVLISGLKVDYLAYHYKVHSNTIYLIKNLARNMNITIHKEPEELSISDMEYCIFCNEKTAYWHIESNRPVCPVCSVINKPEDINSAPYNY